MSALAVQSRPRPAARIHLSELDAAREISRLIAYGGDREDVLASIAVAALRVPGVYKIQIGGASWGNAAGAPLGSAVHGDVRVFFDLQSASLESPLRFARFLDEQVSSLEDMLALNEERRRWSDKLGSLGRVIERRKLIQRARAVLRVREGLTDAAALGRLVASARSQAQTLQRVAEAVLIDRSSMVASPVPIRRYRGGRYAR